jgi:hypothetical protein
MVAAVSRNGNSLQTRRRGVLMFWKAVFTLGAMGVVWINEPDARFATTDVAFEGVGFMVTDTFEHVRRDICAHGSENLSRLLRWSPVAVEPACRRGQARN